MIDIAEFNDEQREILSDAISYLADSRIFTMIANPEYSPQQMKDLLMCALNGSTVYQLDPWEVPDGVLEQARENDYQRVKEMADSFTRTGTGQEKPSIAGKLYAFSKSADAPVHSTEDALVR